jgi:lipoprotein-releasing system ATP-binding protein
MKQAIETSPAVATTSAKVILRASGLRKTYQMGESVVQVLKHVDLAVREGEFLAIEGRSGSGKSTLLHILGALDTVDAGWVDFDGRDLAALSGTERSRLRNMSFGFVFQFYHLLPELNVLENTLLAAMVQHSWLGYRRQRAALRERAAQILAQLGMDHRLTHRPSQLSGGERQRVAIARALMNQPRVLFADEPTGNLDADTGRQIMNVLESLHRMGQTVVMVTHDRTLARQADRVLLLKDGRLEKPSEKLTA